MLASCVSGFVDGVVSRGSVEEDGKEPRDRKTVPL